VSLVDDVLRRAAAAKASDVHFEPTAGGMLVRFRLDGVLSTVETLPRALADNVVSRLKVLGGLLTYRTDIPQEGRLDRRPDTPPAVLDQRLSVFPTIHGQRAVVRLFFDERALTQLDGLGLPDDVAGRLKRFAAGSQGVLLLTGPAGSGKSTTLAALLRHILTQSPGKSVVALEDPVERHIDGVTQVQIAPHGPLTFPTALRSLLRQDPEVLMVGEIRDAETARIVVEAGLTGHLLMSTMHSGTPAGALLRLLEMGIEPYQVTSSVYGVVNQRLVRRLCRRCGGGGRPDGGLRTADCGLTSAQPDVVASENPQRPVCDPLAQSPCPADEGTGAGGCEACYGTGFAGRALLAEMVELDGQLRKAILAKADREELEAMLAARGHMSLRQHGLRRVREGVTTARELDAVCGPAAEAANDGG